MQYFYELAQRSEEWNALRVGKITASRWVSIESSKGPDDWTKGQLSALYEIAAERLTGMSKDFYQSSAMQWGIDHEDDAAHVYAWDRVCDPERCGFILATNMAGFSPDRLVGDDGLLEIKCPNSDTHIKYRANPGMLSDEYGPQARFGLWCSCRKWCDIMSYDPRFIDGNKVMHIERVTLSDEEREKIGARVAAAEAKLAGIMLA